MTDAIMATGPRIEHADSGDVLAWIDTETTGLYAQTDRLLEIACILTDSNLNLLVEEPFHATVRYSADEVPGMKARASEVVQDMHDRSGLWGRLSGPESLTLAAIDKDLLAYIASVAPRPRQARVAGNSVRLDLNFIEANLPGVAAHLHYRSVDVSAISFMANARFGVPFIDKRPAHEALSDILGSLEELRYTLNALAGQGERS